MLLPSFVLTYSSVFLSMFIRGRWSVAPLLFFLTQFSSLSAESIPVRFKEGAMHRYLALRTRGGRIIASGDLIQLTRGDRVISHLSFRFRDGSIDDETAVFTQHGRLQLISDHHVQKGPTFTSPVDVLINASQCWVTVRYGERGKNKVETDHLNLASDLANGIVLNVLKNLQPAVGEIKISYLAATPKPRLIKLSIAPQEEDPFWIAGARQKAIRFTNQRKAAPHRRETHLGRVPTSKMLSSPV
jgi:hypothetical protein